MLSNNVGQPAIIDENADKVATFVLYNHARIVQLMQASEELSAKNQQNSETKVIFFQCIQNKCSVGPEASIPEIEKLKAQLPFLREDFSRYAWSDSLDQGKKQSSRGKGRG